MKNRISIGLHGSTDPETVARVAERAERAGFRGLWLNDVPRGDSLAGLASAAKATSTLRLGSGVIPLDRRPATEILASIAKHELPAERLTVGIGSGGPKRALARVEESVQEIRHGTSAEVMVGALGPKMRALGARSADGVVLNWVTPVVIGEIVRELRDAAGTQGTRTVLYTRTILSFDARSALDTESATYASYPRYAAYFQRHGFAAVDATIDGTAAGALHDAAKLYLESVDELVLRAITSSYSAKELLDFVETAAEVL